MKYSVLLAALLAVSMAACGKKEEAAAPAEAPAAEAPAPEAAAPAVEARLLTPLLLPKRLPPKRLLMLLLPLPPSNSGHGT